MGQSCAKLALDEHTPAVVQRNHEIIDCVVTLGSDRHSNGTDYRQPDLVERSLGDDGTPHPRTDTRAKLGSLLVARTTEWSGSRQCCLLAHQAMLGAGLDPRRVSAPAPTDHSSSNMLAESGATEHAFGRRR